MFKKLLNRKQRKLRKKLDKEILPFREINFLLSQINLIEEYSELRNCQLIGNTRFIISENEKLFFTAGALPGYNISDNIEKWTLCEEDCDGCSYNSSDKSLTFKINRADKFLFGNTISTNHYSANNIYHFFMECLFDVICAKAQNIEIDNIIIPYGLLQRFKEILLSFFPKANLIEIRLGEIITTEKLILFPQRNFQWQWLRQKTAENKQLFEGRGFINQQYLENLQKLLFAKFSIKNPESTNSIRKKIVFIPRKSSFRISLNQEALLTFLKNKCRDHELVILDPVASSFEEIGKILSTADLLFCQCGAALMNVIFANQKNLQVVTWRFFDENQDAIYQEIIEGLGQKYLQIPALLCRAEKTEGKFSHHLASESQSDLLAPIHLIDGLLTEFLNK